jgi:hypothetical protein
LPPWLVQRSSARDEARIFCASALQKKIKISTMPAPACENFEAQPNPKLKNPQGLKSTYGNCR